MSNNKPPFMGELTTLSSLCSKGKSSLRQKDLNDAGSYPVYGASGIVGYLEAYQNDHEYIAVVKDGAGVGRTIKCKGKSSVLGTMQALLPRKGVECDYLLHLVRALNLGSCFSGSTIPHIYFKDYGKLPVPSFSPEQQRGISGRFEKVESLIDLENRTLECLNHLIKSQFVEMFGDSGRIVKLADVCSTYNGDRGKNYPSGKDRVNHGIPFINAGHLVDGRVSFAEMDYITKERYASLSGGKIQYGDILYCLRGSLGKCAVSDFDGGTIASSMMIIRPDTSQILSSFLYQVLNSPTIICQLEEKRNGSSQPNLSARSVSEYKIPVPPIFQQQKFAAFVAEVDKSRFVVQKQIENLQTLYDSLAQEYFG